MSTLSCRLPAVRRLALVRRAALLAGLVIVVSSWAHDAAGVDRPTPDETLRQQLAAGEFGPALERARQAAQPEERDSLLSEVARAQAKAGAMRASLSTLAEVYDDRVRTNVLRETESASPATGGARGGTQADFKSLIDLVTSTIAPTSWDEVGGPGAVSPFPTGVRVDAQGVLQRVLKQESNTGLTGLRLASAEPRDNNANAHRISSLRKISLPRLEKQVQLLRAAGRKPTAEMEFLAGLQKVDYVLVYPDTGDLVIAGPAGDWTTNAEGRAVSTETGRPIVHLDDFVVVLRRMMSRPKAQFGCAITPTQEALARTKAFVEESNKAPLKVGQRDAWLRSLRAQMGQQNITVDGIDPCTRAGLVLVEADYRMKLVGMGLEPGTLGVTSYLDMIQVERGQAPPALDVLRWWFTLNYDAVAASADHDAFELRGQGVQVLSENELLTSLGQRVHTGDSEALNREFAHSFTTHFAALAQRYPVYAELQNIFDLALVAALIKSDGLADRVDWHMTCFNDADGYQVALGPAPRTVETVINHRVINGIHIIAGVSGGVRIDPWKFVDADSLQTDSYGKLHTEHSQSKPASIARDAWWWD